jgi:hypothetical protein
MLCENLGQDCSVHSPSSPEVLCLSRAAISYWTWSTDLAFGALNVISFIYHQDACLIDLQVSRRVREGKSLLQGHAANSVAESGF